MDTSEELPVEALLTLTEHFPVSWDWDAVRGQRIRVRNGMPGAGMLVSVKDSAYRVEIEPGAPEVCLAGLGCPADAVNALELVFLVTTVVATAGCGCQGDVA